MKLANLIKTPDELYQSKSSKWSWDELFSLKTLALVLSPLMVALLGAASRGGIFLYMVLAWTHWDELAPSGGRVGLEEKRGNTTDDVTRSHEPLVQPKRSGFEELLHEWKMDNALIIVPTAIGVALVFFFGIGAFLQWRYYIKQRDTPETWKCQPKRFLKREDERHEVLLGTTNLVIGSTLSGACATYIMNGGDFSRMYYNVSDYGWAYLIATTVLTFLYQDGAAYYIHRLLHRPALYKRLHKHHHRYHSPTAFSAVAMHPVEFLWLECAMVLPIFLIPLHFMSFAGCMFYIYYYGMIDHSGVDLEAFWPWQPPVRFHDDHHKYFHVNFGFNTLLFDRYHDTLRKKTRTYSEKIFGGRGKEKVEAARKDD